MYNINYTTRHIRTLSNLDVPFKIYFRDSFINILICLKIFKTKMEDILTFILNYNN